MKNPPSWDPPVITEDLARDPPALPFHYDERAVNMGADQLGVADHQCHLHWVRDRLDDGIRSGLVYRVQFHPNTPREVRHRVMQDLVQLAQLRWGKPG